jgi:hypothetical protein
VNPKAQERVLAVTKSVLSEGEQVEVMTYASVGTVSLKRKIATAAITTALSGGMLTMHVRPRRFWVVLTSARVLLFDADTASGRRGKLSMALPRTSLTVASSKKGLLTTTVHLAVTGEDHSLRFQFPMPTRADATTLMAAIPAAA